MIDLENYEIIEADSWDLKKTMINKYQELTGRTLTEASPETLIFNTVAYLIGLREEKYNDDIKQNYLKFARDKRLDLKGEFYGKRGERLGEQPATADFKFAISAIQNRNIIIPKGTRIKYFDLYFETIVENKILTGELEVIIKARCKELGIIGNGIPVGQITELVDIYPYYKSVENITSTAGGSDIEDDETYRNRIKDISNSYTTAGSREAYIFWTKSSTPEVVDVTVETPRVGEVDVFVLLKNDNFEELKPRILDVLNDEKIRPLTDKVNVKKINEITYNIDFDYFIDKENEENLEQIKKDVANAVEEYKEWQETKIGRDIIPDELVRLLKETGVKRIVLRAPNYQVIRNNEIAKNNSMQIIYQGVEEK